jgi:hypothetical protein
LQDDEFKPPVTGPEPAGGFVAKTAKVCGGAFVPFQMGLSHLMVIKEAV